MHSQLTICIPSVNLDALVDCCIVSILIFNISHPAHSILQLNHSGKSGSLDQLGNPCPLPPGAACSHAIFDCSVIQFLELGVAKDDILSSKA